MSSRNFYEDVAACVALGSASEAFVLVGPNGMSGLGDARLAQCLAALEVEKVDPVSRLSSDYYTINPANMDVAQAFFNEQAQGAIFVDQIPVTFSVARISDEFLRVYFARVGVRALYLETQQRLSELETKVSALMKASDVGAEINRGARLSSGQLPR